MNLWNVKDLPLPPVTTYRTTSKNIDLKILLNHCKDIKQFFDDNEFLKAEYLVLSRIIYRMKQKFRSAKDFKALEKVHRALENYLNVDISKYITTFMELIPSRYNKDEAYLPTKNLLHYILVRFQGLVKLLDRIVETCKIAGFLLDARMKTGHFWKVAFISFSLISRVYILAKHNAQRICEFYEHLSPFSSQLQNTKRNWLPKDYVLPKDLKTWLNVEWLDITDEIELSESSTRTTDILQFFDLIDDDDDVEFCNEYVMVDDENEVESTGTPKYSVESSDDDLGEVIEIKDENIDQNLKESMKQSQEVGESIENTKKKERRKGRKRKRYYDFFKV